MRKIKVLIVEDIWIVSEEIKEIMESSGFEVIGQAEDSEAAFEVLEKTVADVVLMDIKIKGDLDGIQLAERILKKHNCAIIFLTAFLTPDLAARAKAIKPSAYIVKPFDGQNLQMAVELAFNNMAEEENGPEEESFIVSDHIFVKDGERYKRIALTDILFVNAAGSYTEIITSEAKYSISINLKNFENKVNDKRFIRIHRSHLVNLFHVHQYDYGRVYIGDHSLPISAAYKEIFTKSIRSM